MTTTTTTCRHSTDDLVGYDVQQTIVDRTVLGEAGPIVATVDDPRHYLRAARIAAAHRDLDRLGIRSYAIVHGRYGCGCSDLDVAAAHWTRDT